MKCTCDPARLARIRRTGWMRLIPGLRRYYCNWHGADRLRLQPFG